MIWVTSQPLRCGQVNGADGESSESILVRAYVRASLRACVCACMRACLCALCLFENLNFQYVTLYLERA